MHRCNQFGGKTLPSAFDFNLKFTNIFVRSLKGPVSVNMHGYSDQ